MAGTPLSDADASETLRKQLEGTTFASQFGSQFEKPPDPGNPNDPNFVSVNGPPAPTSLWAKLTKRPGNHSPEAEALRAEDAARRGEAPANLSHLSEEEKKKVAELEKHPAKPPVTATSTSPIDPSSVATSPSQSGGAATGADSITIPPYASQRVKAHDIAVVNPTTIDTMQGHEGVTERAAGDVATAQADQADALGAEMDRAANDAAVQSRINQSLHEDATRDADAKAQALLEKAQAAANGKIDPEHFWNSRTTGQKIMGVIGLALGGISQMYSGHNPASEAIGRAIDHDVAAQEQNLTKGRENLEMQRGVLADQRRISDDANMSRIAAEASGYHYAMAKVDALMQKTNSPIIRQKGAMLMAELQQQFDARALPWHQWQQERYISDAPTPKEIDAEKNRIIETSVKAGVPISELEAIQRAKLNLRTERMQGGTAMPGIAPGMPQKGGGAQQVIQTQLASVRAAQAGLERIIKMRNANNGGSLSPEDKATAAAAAAAVRGEALKGFGGRLTAEAAKTFVSGVPDDPLRHNAAGLIGSDPTMAGMRETLVGLRRIEQEIVKESQSGGAPTVANAPNAPSGYREEVP
jgi:hypothetical protein